MPLEDTLPGQAGHAFGRNHIGPPRKVISVCRSIRPGSPRDRATLRSSQDQLDGDLSPHSADPQQNAPQVVRPALRTEQISQTVPVMERGSRAISLLDELTEGLESDPTNPGFMTW